METATDLATKTAEPFLQSGTLGATVVALGLALLVSWIYFLRRIEQLEKGWRDESGPRLSASPQPSPPWRKRKPSFSTEGGADMFGWLNLKEHQRQKRQQEQLRRLDRAELQAAIQNLHRTRNNIEQLMSKMLEERRA